MLCKKVDAPYRTAFASPPPAAPCSSPALHHAIPSPHKLLIFIRDPAGCTGPDSI